MEGKEKLTLASFLLSIKKLSHLELIWAVVQQKSTQHCKAIILQFKKRKKKKREREAKPQPLLNITAILI